MNNYKAIVLLIDRILIATMQNYQAIDCFWTKYQSVISLFIYAMLGI